MDITSQPIRTFNNLGPNNSGRYICSAESGQAITNYTYILTVNAGMSYNYFFKINIM